MAVLKEYICKAHGIFEAFDAACPYGCKGTMVERDFRSAPSVHFKDGVNRSNNIDKTLNTLASDFNMTDMKHNSTGSVSGNMHQDLAPRWGKGGLSSLQAEGHQLGHSGLNAVKGSLARPEASIPMNVRTESAKELK